ncbi:YolD-like family protein [Paenibacillus sp. SI8]|uniref:YolD-like family protein n=1 Tax=unclassified Paenibacillus TaxID=185978 RepID=UPI0034656D67
MSGKREDDGLRESSQLMLTQHKITFLEPQEETRRQSRPVLDELEIQLISVALSQSQVHAKTVHLLLYGEFENRQISGVVTRSQRDSFRLDKEAHYNDEKEWELISYRDVLNAKLNHEWTEMDS